MNLADFCFFGIDEIHSFANILNWMTGTYFEISFLVWVLNITFSFFKKIVMHFGGVR